MEIGGSESHMDETPDFVGLANEVIERLLKTDRKSWSQLAQYGLFDPGFFAVARKKCSHTAGNVASNDDRLAALIAQAGLKVLSSERVLGDINCPLHAAAMLLSFPQVNLLPPHDANGTYDWYIPEKSHSLDSYWKNTFPTLESAVINKLYAVQLVQRKTGAPSTYSSLTSPYHAAQFRRIAALSLISENEALRRTSKPLPAFNVKWGESIRATSERPLFVSLIADFYQAVYDALDGKSLPAMDALPRKITSEVVFRYAFFIAIAALPTIYNAFFGHRSLMQLLFDCLHTNTASGLTAASLVGYVRSTFVTGAEGYNRLIKKVAAFAGGPLLLAAGYWAVQENFKWTFYDRVYQNLNSLFMITMHLVFLTHMILFFISGMITIRHSAYDKSLRPIRYPAAPMTFMLLFAMVNMLPPVLFPEAGLNYSPTAGTFLAGTVIVLTALSYLLVCLVNYAIEGRMRAPRGWSVALINAFQCIGLMLLLQVVPREPISVVVVFGAFIFIAALVGPAVYLNRSLWRR